MKVYIIGASGSLGRALAEAEAQQKSELVLVSSDARDLAPMKADLSLRYGISVSTLALDLSKSDSLNRIGLEGHRYYFPIGATVDNDRAAMDSDKIHRVFQVNLFAVSDLVSKLMARNPKMDVDIVGFGSIAQTRGRSDNVYYSAAKRSLTSLFESLLHGSGGDKTRPYLFQIGYMKSQLSFGKKMLLPPAEPAVVAKKALYHIHNKNPGIYYIPGFWRLVCFVLLLVPWPIYRKMKF
jgi:short-subunit dehydrogenase